MSECVEIDSLQASFLVSIGAVSGACLRVRLISYLKLIVSATYLATLLVNLLASFLLGLIYGFHRNCHLDWSLTPFTLLIAIGFLGSFSTFSAFAFELYEMLCTKRFEQFASLLFVSLLGGLIAIRIGYLLTYAPIN